MALEFSPPSGWCDAACERCPLQQECQAIGVEDSLGDALAMLRRTSGDDDDLWRSPNPASLLEQAALEHALSIKALLDSLRPDEWPQAEHAELALAQACLLGGKVGRLANDFSANERPLEDNYHGDTVPNLLLIAHALGVADRHMARLSRAVQRLSTERYRRQRGELRALLMPLVAAIPTRQRTAFKALVASGRAPSPFCRVPGP